jgi:hypothetical protein
MINYVMSKDSVSVKGSKKLVIITKTPPFYTTEFINSKKKKKCFMT